MSDLISRQEAIEALRYAQHRFTVADEAGGMGTVKWSEDVIYFDAAVNALSFLPSAEPDRRIGKWIMQNPMVDTEECSECGYNILSEEFETPFCPWCGADMRGSNDEYEET